MNWQKEIKYKGDKMKIKNWKLLIDLPQRMVYKNTLTDQYACAYYNRKVDSWIAFASISKDYRPRVELEPARRKLIGYSSNKADIKRKLVAWLIRHPYGTRKKLKNVR